jgi:hypothetical protein
MLSLTQNPLADDQPAHRIPRRSNADWPLRLGILAVIIIGCGQKASVIPYLDDLKGAGDRIDLRAEQIGDDAKAVKPRTDKVGKVYVARIETNAEKIGEDVQVQQKAADRMGKAHADLAEQLRLEKEAHARDNAHHDALWYVKVGRWVDWVIHAAWWALVLIIGGGFILRIIGMFAGGWIGATMAKLGSIGLHFLPWIGGIANQFFDNAFFRQRQYVLESPKPTPSPVVVVDKPPVVVEGQP